MNRQQVRERRELRRKKAADWLGSEYVALRVALRMARGEHIADELFRQYNLLPMCQRYSRRSLLRKWVDFLIAYPEYTNPVSSTKLSYSAKHLQVMAAYFDAHRTQPKEKP